MQKSINIICQTNEKTSATISMMDDIIVHSELLSNIYNDMKHPDTIYFVNDIVTYEYLTIVHDIIREIPTQISDMPLPDFLKLLNVLDYLIVSEKIDVVLSQLMIQKATNYATIEFKKVILILNECNFCRYIEKFITHLFECRSNDVIQFVKNNQIHEYNTIFIENTKIQPLLHEYIISFYKNTVCERMNKYIQVNSRHNVVNIICQTIDGKKGSKDTLTL